MTTDVVLVVLIAGLLVPVLNALLTKATASPALKSIVATLLAGIAAVIARITEAGDVTTLKELVVVFGLTLATAGGLRLAATSHLENAVGNRTQDLGLGKTPPYDSPGHP